jgi:hypothetical protein
MTERVTLDLTEHHETDDAYLLSASGEKEGAVWIPKTLCTKVADDRFEIDRWKAKECDLLDVPPVDQMRLF